MANTGKSAIHIKWLTDLVIIKITQAGQHNSVAASFSWETVAWLYDHKN